MVTAQYTDVLGRILVEWEAETEEEVGAMVASGLLAGDGRDIWTFFEGDSVIIRDGDGVVIRGAGFNRGFA